MERHLDYRTAARFAEDTVSVLVLSRGMTITGKPFYAFAKIRPSRYNAFKAAEASGEAYRIQDYGELLAYAYQRTPTDDTLERMRALCEMPPPPVTFSQSVSV